MSFFVFPTLLESWDECFRSHSEYIMKCPLLRVKCLMNEITNYLIHKKWFYSFKSNNQSIHPSSFALLLLKTEISFKFQGILGTINLFNHRWLNLDFSSCSLFIAHMKMGFLKPKPIVIGLFPRYKNINVFSSMFSWYQHHHLYSGFKAQIHF